MRFSLMPMLCTMCHMFPKCPKQLLSCCKLQNRPFHTAFTFYIAISSVKCRPLQNRGLFAIIRTEKITKEKIWKITKEGTWEPRDLGHLEEAVDRPVTAGKSGCIASIGELYYQEFGQKCFMINCSLKKTISVLV